MMTNLSTRTHYYILSALLCWVMLLVGCGGSSVRKELASMDSLIEKAPDSAYDLMAKMDVSSWSHGERMRYELMKADAQNKARIDVVSSSTMKEVVDYFDSHGNNNEKMKAYYLLGSVYRDLDSIPEALNAFNKAIEIADTIDADCNFIQLATIHSHKANLFFDLYPSDYAIKEKREAAYFYLKGDDIFNYAVTNEWLGDIYSRLGEQEEAKKYGVEAYHEFQKISKRDAALSAMSLALIFIRFGETDKAMPLLDEFEKEIDIKQANNRRGEIFDGYYLAKAHVLLYKGENIKALEHLRLVPKNDVLLNLDIARCYVDLYEKLGQKDSIVKYQELAYNLQDKIYKESKANNLQQMQAMYDYAQKEQEAKEASLENFRLKGYLIIIIIILSVGSLAVYNYIHRKKEKERKLEHSYMTSMVMLNVAQQELAIIKEKHDNAETLSDKLKAEIDALREKAVRDSVLLEEKMRQEAEWHTQKTQLELLLKDKEHEIDTIKQSLNELSGIETPEPVELSPELCTAANRLHLIASKGQHANNADLAILADYAKKSLPNFFHEIHSRYSDMSSQLDDICVLLRLNFSPYEIGVLLQMSPQAVTNARRRLMKKLFDEDASVRRFDKLLKEL